MDIFQYSKKLNHLSFFNTKTRKKERFKPLNKSSVTMYTCGPTVYNYAHIGNYRTYVFEDLLRRTLKMFGYQVHQVMNLTDVDDKTIKGATESKISLDEYTKVYKEAFFSDLRTLNVERVEHYPEATNYIPHMIKMIQTLFDKGYAYQGGDDSIYFSIKKFKAYGKLSHIDQKNLKTGGSQRVTNDEYEKDTLADFVLWKSYDSTRDGSIFWESPFGPGRPGWHIECSTMAMEILGKTLDIHVGGVDNIFPHHENEIAQSEACTNKSFANLWLHSEHLIVDNKKMSKSLGNFYTLRDLTEKGYNGRQIRYLLLQTHYKTQLNFTLEGLKASSQTLQRIDDFIYRLNNIKNDASGSSDNRTKLNHFIENFANALADDLNIPEALAYLFDFIRDVNSLADLNKISTQDASDILEGMKVVDTALGIIHNSDVEEKIPENILDALKKRNQARASKDWGKADFYRDFIHENGYTIEDSSKGSRLKKIKL